MAISDKTRKVLWGRSGNRCAICRQRLVVDETSVDAESVVGDECHIHSGAIGGPRYDAAVEPQNIDHLDNLLLLCRVHHKMADDQFETYTADLLRSIKLNHERWVDAQFADKQAHAAVKIRRLKHEIPARLMPVESGADLFNLAYGCHGSYQDHSIDLNDEEVEIVGGFLQSLQDLVDTSGDLGPIDRVRAKKFIDNELVDLKSRGFIVFAAKERQRLEGGVGEASDFFVLHVTVARENDPNILFQEGA